ncbi:M48 family metallopeptidase [Salipiger abyssi]|uniref:M48 family metallopeptidase n=1 Tax=Salipiger abyssi TaxID=1250539 RepID=UPI001A8E3617|nr:M48 family metallopeptidase [Salipiger abyssi]MBN9888613.1 M48 family metallopeptidase [Salipiger abyssi]
MKGDAHLYDGRSAARHAVHVELSRDLQALVITGEALPEPLVWPLPDLRALGDHADDSQIVLARHRETEDESLRDPARLVVEDPEMVAWLRRTRPRLNRKDLRTGTGRRIALRLGGALAAVALMLFVILPALANTLAGLLPLEKEIAFGRSVKAQMERFLGATEVGALDCDEPDGQAALDRMVARLTEGQDLDYPLEVSVIDHKMMNAFAAPGGQIVVVRGLLDKADGPDMVAAVLAHEIGHVVHRDPTRHALRSAGSVGLLGLVFGDFTGGAAMVFLAERLINASYSQSAEAEADAYAHEALLAAGLPPSALGDMFETFRAEFGDREGPMAHFASHPQLSARIAAARAATPEGLPDRPVLDAAEWQALKTICDGRG